MTKLAAPVAYQGGKSRIASKIIDILWAGADKRYYDLCCGSGAIAIELVNRGVPPKNITMVDAGPWGLFWHAIGEGFFDLSVFEENLRRLPAREAIQAYLEEIAKQDTTIDTVYRFLIMQAGAFGSKPVWINGPKWMTPGFRSYWTPTETSSRRYPVNPMMPMPDTLLERAQALAASMKGVFGHCADVNDITIEPSAIVYVDPPYAGTTSYGYDFDVVKFANSLPNTVYVSEGRALGEKSFNLSTAADRAKGGITGNRKKASNEEWLTAFRRPE